MKAIQYLSFFSLCLFAATVHGQIYVDADATGTNDGTSWANAYTSLNDALDAATDGNQLWVAAGTYKPATHPLPDGNSFLIASSIELYGGFAGIETMLDQRDWAAHPTIISGDINGDDVTDDFDNNRSDNAWHALRIVSDGVVLDGFVVENGHTSTETFPDSLYVGAVGGGCLVEGDDANIENCTFRQNYANNGAALYVLSTESSAINYAYINGCTFEHNHAKRSGGLTVFQSNFLVSNCSFLNNTAVEFAGGVLLGNSSGTLTNCMIDNNSVSDVLGWGGGIGVFHNTPSISGAANVTVEHTRVSNNYAYDVGGGLYYGGFIPDMNFSIRHCHFDNNNVNAANTSDEDNGHGGSIYIGGYNNNGVAATLGLEISDCKISNSGATFGGGVVIEDGATEMNYHINRDTFENNYGSTFGGAVTLGNTDGIIEHSIFTDNDGGYLGGGVFVYNNANRTRPAPNDIIRNNLFMGNTAFYGAGVRVNNFFDGTTFQIIDNQFMQNTAIEQGGGASAYNYYFNVENGLSGHISNNTFSQNSSILGGGVYLKASSSVDSTKIWLENNVYIGNAAVSGGGLYVTKETDDRYHQIVLTNEYFDNNDCSYGGAIFIGGADSVYVGSSAILNHNNNGPAIFSNSSMNIRNSTIVNNLLAVDFSGDANVQLQNNIFESSFSNLVSDADFTIASLGANLSSDNSMDNWLNASGAYPDINAQPADLDANMVPTANSICVDAGNPAGITTSTDLAGNPRIQGNQIDIGAYESSFTVSASEELERQGIAVYPNPFVEKILLSDVTQIERIVLRNITGSAVQYFDIRQELSVNPHLPAGFYLLDLTVNGKRRLLKLEKGK